MISLFRIDYYGEKYNPDTGLYYSDIIRYEFWWIDDEHYPDFEEWTGDMAPDIATTKILEVSNYDDTMKIRRASYIH